MLNWEAAFSMAGSGAWWSACPVDCASTCTWQARSNCHMSVHASPTVRPAVSSPWFRMIIASLSPRSVTSRSHSSVSTATPSNSW